MNPDAELDRLKAELPRSIEPARDLWPQIADHISRGKIVAGEFGSPPARRAWMRPAALAAAAVTLVVLSSAVTRAVLGPRIPEPGLAAVNAIVADFAGVESEYASAASEILRAVRAGDVQLSPTTVAVLEKNIQLIDDAIRESRQALAADPANSALREMVLASYRQKLDLLRRATAASVDL